MSTQTVELNRGGAKGGGCCGFIALILLIGGGIMYGVCKDAELNGKCGGHQEIADAGFGMLIAGASIFGLIVALFVMLCICGGGALCCFKCLED